MIYILKDAYNAIISYCQEKLPYEACGLLAGVVDGADCHIERIYPMTNKEESAWHFSMKPKEQIEAAKDMRRRGCKLIAIFHSHPYSEAYPSGEDILLANDESVCHLIVSLKNKDAPKINAFIIDGEKNVLVEQLIVGYNNGAEVLI